MFRNREFRLLMLAAAVIISILLAALVITLSKSNDQLVSNVINRDTAVIGRLVSSHPELKEDIAAAFSATLSEEYYEQGLDAAAKFGYTQDFVTNTAFLKQSILQSITKVLLICIFAFLMFFLLVYIVFYIVFRKMKMISKGIEDVMDGRANTKLPEDMEGDAAILSFNVNQMISRMNSFVEKLQLEKNSIKSMMSNVSHQMKTPIASLKMFNEILERDDNKEEVRKEFIERSCRLIERIERLVENLLKYSKMHSGAVNLNMRQGRINDVLSSILEDLKPLFNSRHQEIITDMKDSGESLFDPEWLYEALENIIKNASDYTKEGNAIEIISFKDIEGIKIKIKDSGCGISPDDRGRIFEPFYRGRVDPDSKNADKNQRTGIGLALSKLLIEKHNGYITLDTSPGIGSTFTVILP